jgi:hypothetical protein
MRSAARTFLVIMIDSFLVATSIHPLIEESRSSLKNTTAIVGLNPVFLQKVNTLSPLKNVFGIVRDNA